MNGDFYRIEAAGISLVLDMAVGHIRSFEVEHQGRRIAPLYTAPWVEEPEIAADESIPPNLRRLSGDFFCAPFGTSDVEAAPPHGWPANSPWQPLGDSPYPEGGIVARFALEHRVMGARVVKEITLRDHHPFAYQRHVFEGGEGQITAASHAMTRFARSGRLSFSAKRFGEMPRTPLEPDPARGRYALCYPARFSNLTNVPLADGGKADLTRYPIASGHEDFVMLVEATGSTLAWAAACRTEERDIILSLKNPDVLPVTMLWISNGGRDYPPWNGRNFGVLGIEEARAYSAYGHAAAIAPNPLSDDEGVPTAFELGPDKPVDVRHVIGALALPAGFDVLADLGAADGKLRLASPAGAAFEVPYDAAFLA